MGQGHLDARCEDARQPGTRQRQGARRQQHGAQRRQPFQPEGPHRPPQRTFRYRQVGRIEGSDLAGQGAVTACQVARLAEQKERRAHHRAEHARHRLGPPHAQQPHQPQRQGGAQAGGNSGQRQQPGPQSQHPPDARDQAGNGDQQRQDQVQRQTPDHHPQQPRGQHPVGRQRRAQQQIEVAALK